MLKSPFEMIHQQTYKKDKIKCSLQHFLQPLQKELITF